ncbi:hypothetical protein MASR1M45_23040 [Candidatus Kapaibacterium sp.]
MIPNNTPSEHYFMVYDRVAREIIFFQTIPISQYSFVYSYMHTSNQMAYGEVIKLEGDIKPYSYIRIFDLDKRENVRNVRVGEEKNGVAVLTIKNDDKFAIWILFNDNNYQYFYDITNDRISDFKINTLGTVLLSYDIFLVTYTMKGYKFDWNAVGVDDEPNPSIPVIYPNPTTNSINLEISEVYFNGIWEITDLTGTRVIERNNTTKSKFSLRYFKSAISNILFAVTNGKKLRWKKVVKW